MSLSSNPPAMSLPRRLVQICTSPRTALAAATGCSLAQVLLTWAILLALWGGAAWWLLSSPVGRQALVDERVRVIEVTGGRVDDTEYAALQGQPPYWIYFTSGGRLLLFPVVTLAVAAGLALWPGRQGPAATGPAVVPALSVAVHANAALVVQQLVATPLHLMRESLTSPFNVAAVLPFFDEGSLGARFFGTIEFFGLWWVGLLAVGAAALAGRRAREYVGPLVGVYVGVAAAIAGLIVLTGGA